MHLKEINHLQLRVAGTTRSGSGGDQADCRTDAVRVGAGMLVQDVVVLLFVIQTLLFLIEVYVLLRDLNGLVSKVQLFLDKERSFHILRLQEIFLS